MCACGLIMVLLLYSNLGLAGSLASPSFFLPDENYVIAIHLKMTAVILASTCALIIIFVPKFVSIVRYLYGKHKSKLWRGYRGNRSNSAGYFNDGGYGGGSSSQEHNNSDNMATQNLLDFSVQAHEGVLPVKKMARFNYMSIWELKHVVVVPLKRFFILMNVRKGQNDWIIKGTNHGNRNKAIKHEYTIILHVNPFQHPRIDVYFAW